MKRKSILLVLVLLINAYVLVGYAESNINLFETRFIEYQNRTMATHFTEDGRVLFALYHNERYTENNYVDSMVCLASNGDILWKRDIPLCGQTSGVVFEEISGGNFALAGKYVNGGLFILLMDANGKDIKTIDLEEDALFPVMSADSAFYLSRQTKSLQELKYDDGSKKTIDGTSGSLVFFVVEGTDANYFSVILRKDKDTTVNILLCVDLQGNLKWSREMGDFMKWSVERFTCNNLGGITVPMTYTNDNGKDTLYIMCLDGNGERIWSREVSSPDVDYPTPYVMLQNEKGEYMMWGHAGITQNWNISFWLRLDENGLYIDSGFKSQWGKYHQYMNGETYVTVTEYIGNKLCATALVPFDKLEDFQSMQSLFVE